MSEELKPCPFCGEIPGISPELEYFILSCSNPDCILYDVRIMFDDLLGAIAAWNNRPAALAPLDDGFGNRWPATCRNCGAPMQIVRPGEARCSAECWMTEEETTVTISGGYIPASAEGVTHSEGSEWVRIDLSEHATTADVNALRAELAALRERVEAGLRELEAFADPIGTSAAIGEYGKRLDTLEADAFLVGLLRDALAESNRRITALEDENKNLQGQIDELASDTSQHLDAAAEAASDIRSVIATIKERNETLQTPD